MFDSKDVAEYYNTTQNHYEIWWDLDKGLSLHYGIWEDGIKSFTESVINTNRTLFNIAQISPSDKVLDAGCGVGGAAAYINGEVGAEVIGITLSEVQVDYASKMAARRGINDKVSFRQMDYTKTDFEDESFDVVWACESVSSAPDQTKFIEEAYRVLKPGGTLIMSDCFLTSEDQNDPQDYVKKWGHTWGVSGLVTADFFADHVKKTGFSKVDQLDYTEAVRKSAKRMYLAGLAAKLPSELYNITHPKVSRFAKTHYKSGIYQYKAYKKGLWKYVVIHATK